MKHTFKVGQKVRIKTQEEIDAFEKEHGCVSSSWVEAMNKYSGEIHTIGSIDGKHVEFDNPLPGMDDWGWSVDMIVPADFKFGDEVLVRDDNREGWVEAIFIGYGEGEYLWHVTSSIDRFKNDCGNYLVNKYKQCKHKEETLEVTLDEVAEKFGVSNIKIKKDNQ